MLGNWRKVDKDKVGLKIHQDYMLRNVDETFSKESN